MATQTFEYEIEIEARSEAEADERVEAFTNLDQSLDHRDLVECATFVSDYPITVKTIKDILPSLENVEVFGLISMAPDLIKKLKAAIDADKKNLYEDE